MTGLALKSSNDQLFERLSAAKVDCRGHNARYRQNQLHLLHAFLCQNVDRICDAVQKDCSSSEAEAISEYFFMMSAVSQLYNEVDFDETLRQEYSVANKKNHVSRRVPYGIVVIRPGNYSRVFSIVAPLVAAMAAGNCVLVELPHTLHRIDQIIRECFAVLDHDAFAVTSHPITDEDFLSNCLVIDELGNIKYPGDSTVSAGTLPNIAIVHRNANVSKAAESLCRARFRFQGQSPYAPDIILVNEWVKNEFIEACLRAIAKEPVVSSSQKGATGEMRRRPDFDAVLGPESVKMLYSSPSVRVAELTDRSMAADIKAENGQTLIILSVTSLIDAVSLAGEIPSINACYAFAQPADAKYLCQQIDSNISFVNDIPSRLLVGPAVSKDVYHQGSDLRYDTFMMSRSHPEYVDNTSPVLEMIAKVLSTEMSSQSSIESKLKALKAEATTPLNPTGQASGTSMGFFDQGILTGLIAFVLPTVCLTGVGMFYAGKFAYRRFY